MKSGFSVLDAYFYPDSEIDQEVLGSDICLYRQRDDQVVILNRTAADIWSLTDGATTVSETIEILARNCAVAPDEIEPEVRRVLTELVEIGFLHERDSAVAANS